MTVLKVVFPISNTSTSGGGGESSCQTCTDIITKCVILIMSKASSVRISFLI